MASKSLWMDVDVAPDALSLNGAAECDVVVVGSGIAGISTAYELSKRGKTVMVIDRGHICGGMTSRTSAHLAPLCDDLVSEMTRIKGRDATKLFCDSQASAVDRIEEIQKKEEIDCDFRRLDGYLFQGRNMPADTIDQEMDAVRDIGAPVHRLMGVPFNACEDRHVLRYPRQATFHPLKYLAGVVRACRTSGVTFFRDSPVEEVTEDNGAVSVKTERGVIRAQYGVVATNSSISDRFAIHPKTAPYQRARLPRLPRKRLHCGKAAGPARAQNLSRQMQVLRRQGEDCGRRVTGALAPPAPPMAEQFGAPECDNEQCTTGNAQPAVELLPT